MLISLIYLMSYLYNMYVNLDPIKSLAYKIINGIHHTLVTIINFILLYISSKMEPKKNVEKREEDKNKEELDPLKEGANLLALLIKKKIILDKLKGLEANGNEEAGRTLRSIEESLSS